MNRNLLVFVVEQVVAGRAFSRAALSTSAHPTRPSRKILLHK